MATFSLEIENGLVEDLDYSFSPINTLTAEGPVVLNFPLLITGTDIASGNGFEYEYVSSTELLSSIPEPGTLALFSLALVGFGFTQAKMKAQKGWKR